MDPADVTRPLEDREVPADGLGRHAEPLGQRDHIDPPAARARRTISD